MAASRAWMNNEEWSWCACGGQDNLYPDYDGFYDYFNNQPCGCGLLHLRHHRDNIIHWRGGHWLPMCAFNVVTEELKAARKHSDILEDVIFGGEDE